MALAVYLKALRLLLDDALEARQGLVRRIGTLLDEARTANPGAIVRTTAEAGADHASLFGSLRRRHGELEVPPPCKACHEAVGDWLDKTVQACVAMTEVVTAGSLRPLRDTQAHLAASRNDARKFNAEYERLIAELKRRATARRGKPKMRPLGRLRGLLLRRPAS